MSIDGFSTGKPAGTDELAVSDDAIRANNLALDNWALQDHGTDGTHKIITLTPQSDQSGTANEGKLYGKDVADKIELFYTDEVGNDVQLTSGGSSSSAFNAGTRMWFFQNSAPTGWSVVSGLVDVLLAVKGGSNNYNVLGGNTAGTWTQAGHTLTTAEIPAHSHTLAYRSANYVSTAPGYLGYLNVGAASSTGTTGGGGSHNHGSSYRPKAAVGIVCQKS